MLDAKKCCHITEFVIGRFDCGLSVAIVFSGRNVGEVIRLSQSPCDNIGLTVTEKLGTGTNKFQLFPLR